MGGGRTIGVLVEPRMIGITADSLSPVWEDEPGWWWIDDPANPGYVTRRPRLDGEPERARKVRRSRNTAA